MARIEEASVDVFMKENLKKLVEIGEKLMEKPISGMINLETGLLEPIKNAFTNEEGLRKYEKTFLHVHRSMFLNHILLSN